MRERILEFLRHRERSRRRLDALHPELGALVPAGVTAEQLREAIGDTRSARSVLRDLRDLADEGLVEQLGTKGGSQWRAVTPPAS